jgi:mannosyltransferase OCH1-like enzyme
MIEHICHQLWKSETIPDAFKESTSQVKQLCESLGWTYRVWTESQWMDVIENHYKFLHKTYELLNIIQKVHLAKYVILYHFGGLYLDLDVTPTSHLKAWMTSDKHLIIAREQNNYSLGIFLARAIHHFFKQFIYDFVNYKPTHIATTFRHYDTLARTGINLVDTHIDKLDKSDSNIHIQSAEQPLVTKVLHTAPSTWREWDSYVFDYLQYAWQYRDRIMLTSGVLLALVILILIALVFKKLRKQQRDHLIV